MRVAVAIVAGVFACAGADLETAVRQAIEGSPPARQAFWGVRVADVTTGDVLFALNADKFFIPASNTKLFTTALAFLRLGPDYKFVTRVEADARPDRNGRVRQLRLIGGGDPNLSARILPYVRNKTGPNPLAALEQLADQVVAAGVREVDELTGDDTAYDWEPYPDGWAVDDPVWEYGAPVSALTVNDNSFTLNIAPGEVEGAPAKVSLWPGIEYFVVHNRTRTVAGGEAKMTIDRIPGSRELILGGTVATRSTSYLAVDDPALFAAMCLRDALLERGVRVRSSRAAHRRANEDAPEWQGVELARHTSAPLSEAITVANKVSQNLHTEMILREIARKNTGVGSRREGLKAIEEFLTELGVADTEYNFEDASGLSRLTLVTPDTIGQVLLHMYRSPHRELWMKTLPVGGVDGTLATRFDSSPAGANIRAKTGSISHVSSLSGYALRKDGKVLAFTIVANNYNSPHTPVRKVIDRIALALLD